VIVHVAARRLREKVLETPAALAVRTAVWDVGTFATTVAEKLTVFAPDGTVTLAGTVTLELLLARATTNPPVRAAPLSVTVQAEVPAAFTVVGVHESAVSVGETGWRIVSIPPVPEAEMEAPIGLVTITPVSWIGEEVSKELAAIVNVTFATVPSLITFVLIP
jgi:hypothetical protein